MEEAYIYYSSIVYTIYSYFFFNQLFYGNYANKFEYKNRFNLAPIERNLDI